MRYINLLILLSLTLLLTACPTSSGPTTKPDFSISLSNQNPTANAGQDATVTVNINPSGGFNDAVNLTIDNPADVNANFSPGSVTTGSISTAATSTLTLNSDVAGTYSMTVTATGGGITKTASLTLNVNTVAVPDFTLSLSNQNPTANAGQDATVTVNINPSGGFNDAVNLTIDNPADVNANFSPGSVTTGSISTAATSTLTLNSDVAGTYSMTVTATGGGITKTASLTLNVNTVAVPDFTLSLSNSAPSFVEGGNTTVTVTVNPTDGFDSAVNLTINAPANVNANFNPPSATNTSTLTLSSAVEGTYPMTVTGTSGSITRQTALTLTVTPPATITVSGLVTDSNNQPAAGVVVVIFGDNNPNRIQTLAGVTSTDANGQFTLSGITSPYDLGVITNQGNGAAIVYEDLSTPNPTAFFPFAIANEKTAFVNGDVSGGANYPLPANHTSRVAFGSPEVNQEFVVNNTSGNFDFTIDWFGPVTTTGMLHALQWEFETNSGFQLPTDYTGYGKHPSALPLSDGNTANNKDIALTALGEQNIGGSFNPPPGYTLNTKFVEVELDPFTSILVVGDGNKNPNFNYVTPQINGATGRIIGIATSNTVNRSTVTGTSGIALNNTAVSITMPEAPGLLVPVNNSSNITTSTNFQINPFGAPQSAHLVSFLGSGNAPNFFVFTTSSSTTIPDLSAFGLSVPPSANYAWRSTGLNPINNTNDMASPNLIKIFNGTADDFAFGESEDFTFTTSSNPNP